MAENELETQILDYAFTITEEECPDPKLRQVYEVMVQRMRREAENLPLNTHHQFMIERIAHFYVVVRQKEKIALGQAGGFPHVTAQKEANAFWLSMVTEFNKMLRSLEAERQRRLLEMMRDTINKALDKIEDNRLRTEIVDMIADEFDKAGIV